MDTTHATTHGSSLFSTTSRARPDAPTLLVVLGLVMAVLLLVLFGAVVRNHVETAQATRQAAREGSMSPVAALAAEGSSNDAQAATGPRTGSIAQAK